PATAQAEPEPVSRVGMLCRARGAREQRQRNDRTQETRRHVHGDLLRLGQRTREGPAEPGLRPTVRCSVGHDQWNVMPRPKSITLCFHPVVTVAPPELRSPTPPYAKFATGVSEMFRPTRMS